MSKKTVTDHALKESPAAQILPSKACCYCHLKKPSLHFFADSINVCKSCWSQLLYGHQHKAIA